jgi:hypothetical protein
MWKSEPVQTSRSPPPTPAPTPAVTLTVAAPARGETVNDTTELRFTGTNLSSVRVYWRARPVATATVTGAGTAAGQRGGGAVLARTTRRAVVSW